MHFSDGFATAMWVPLDGALLTAVASGGVAASSGVLRLKPAHTATVPINDERRICVYSLL
jgi:hypothetical protein